MTAFQGKQLAGPSLLFKRIVEQIEAGHPDPGFQRKAAAVARLSRLFTKERETLGADYLEDPHLAAAYFSYFFPVNLSKIQALLEELPEDWCRPSESRPLRVLDLGTGPGTGAVAVLDWLNQHDPDALKQLTVVGIDVSTQALSRARGVWRAYSRQIGVAEERLVLYEGDLTRPSRPWHEAVAQRGPYDLVIIANCLNELFRTIGESIKERVGLIADMLATLAPHGTLMIVEPALRETSRALHQIRDRLLAEHRCTIYSPCLHEKNCPALLNPDDWCHEERPWEPPSWIQRIDHEVGFIKDALKFSYLLLRTDGRTIVERAAETFRMVSELRKLKGDTRAWLCNELGRQEVGRLERASSADNAAWDRCGRGTIIRIEGITKKEGSTLGRIPPQGKIEILRPS